MSPIPPCHKTVHFVADLGQRLSAAIPLLEKQFDEMSNTLTEKEHTINKFIRRTVSIGVWRSKYFFRRLEWEGLQTQRIWFDRSNRWMQLYPRRNSWPRIESSACFCISNWVTKPINCIVIYLHPYYSRNYIHQRYHPCCVEEFNRVWMFSVLLFCNFSHVKDLYFKYFNHLILFLWQSISFGI
jgi:hypothetical protein